MTGRRALTVTDPTCEVVVFMRANGSAQAVITPKNRGPSTHEIPAPAMENEHIVVKRLPDGCVEVLYEDIK